MRIAFVTGCLEPGRDGVGDYTLTLAAECVRRGHEVRLLSLAEKEAGVRSDSLDRLRLASTEWRQDGGAAARRWLEAFRPNWVSLQFVPYCFDPRGFFAASIRPLVELCSAAPRCHLYVHELWIGSYVGAQWKSRLIGSLQRLAMTRLLRRLRPDVVHTSTAYYQAALASIGHSARLLRMFGSVPPSARTVADVASSFPAEALVCGHFGTLHPNWRADEFLGELAALAGHLRRRPFLVSTGGLGYGQSAFRALAARWRQIEFVELGRRDIRELAVDFARFDFAVTSVPWNAIGKSSSTAALREHGIKVVVTAAGSPPRFTSGLQDDAADDAGLVPFFRTATMLSSALDRPAIRRSPLRFHRQPCRA